MTTNLLAQILIVYATNTVEHWPQKPGPPQHNPDYDVYMAEKMRTHPYTLEYMPDTIVPWVDDINADTKSVETKVTAEKRLQFDYTEMHPETNGTGFDVFLKHFDLVITNWTTEHYQVDYRRVRTNAFVGLAFHLITEGDSRFGEVLFIPGVKFDHADDRNHLAVFSYPTNWFEPVATNKVYDGWRNGLVSLTNTSVIYPWMVVTNLVFATNVWESKSFHTNQVTSHKPK